MDLTGMLQAAAGVSTGNPNAWDISKAYYDAGADAGDVSKAAYSGSSANVSAQISANAGSSLAFSADGTKFYAANQTTVYQYSSSNAWAVNGFSYDSKSFSVASQETSVGDIAFKTDGTKMYVVGGANTTVYQYSLSTAWDVSSASYDSVSFSVASQDAAPRGLFFKPDGTKMYIAGAAGVDINEYDLSSAWDVSSASYVQNFSVSGQEATPEGVSFLGDGTKMYVVGSSGDEVNEYSLSTPWDISSASYVQTFSLSTQTLNPKAIVMKPDGSLFFVYSGVNGSGTGESTVYQYTIGGFSVAAKDVNPRGLAFKPDGTKMYINGGSNNVHEYTLSTAWEPTSATFVQSFDVSAQEAACAGVTFSTDGTNMYVTGYSGDEVNQYSLSTAWDISTASYVRNFSISAQDTAPRNAFFSDDGTLMFIGGTGTNKAIKYSLSTAWNISTASLVETEVYYQPYHILYKTDGTKLYWLQSPSYIVQFDLATAWDIPASGSSTYGIGTATYNVQSMVFNPNGEEFFVIDLTTDKVLKYSISPT